LKGKNSLLDPYSINRLSNLQVRARAVVEGFLTGLHQSPYHGFSVEFSQHRQYITGDSLRHLDYKILAKTGRYYIKQYEEETNLKSTILFDHSGSMKFGSGELTKLEYGKVLAASLSLLLLKQRDAVGLVTFAEEVTSILPPKSALGWLETLSIQLNETVAEGDTSVTSSLYNVAERIKRRGLVIVISDLLDDPDKIIAGFKALRHVGHDMMVFQVLDPKEISFDYPKDARFQDLESGQILPSKPWHIRDEYRTAVNEFIDNIRVNCRSHNIDYHLFTTDIPYSLALFEFLDRRRRML